MVTFELNAYRELCVTVSPIEFMTLFKKSNYSSFIAFTKI